jgi:hypothetical protein
MKFKVGKSDIHGKGLIVKKPISEGETIGLAHVDNKPTSVIGKYHNHADDPTATSLEMGNKRYLIALRDLNPGDEITTNYRLQPELEQPEDFQDGGQMTPQKDGYRTYSPYRNLPYIDINSNVIDTNNLAHDGLILIGDNGIVKQVANNSGNITIPGADSVREIPYNLKKGGLVRMPKPSKKGLASKAYTKSLDGTNKLFTENYLFEKPKSRKRKVFDPNAKYYQEGGDIPTLPLREGRLAYERLVYNVNDKIAKANQGGYIELDLDNDEIEQYKRQGYIVEELDSYQEGGSAMGPSIKSVEQNNVNPVIFPQVIPEQEQVASPVITQEQVKPQETKAPTKEQVNRVAMPTLEKTGDVKAIQKKLVAAGYDLGKSGSNHDGVDGIMGNRTKMALDAFNAGIPPSKLKTPTPKPSQSNKYTVNKNIKTGYLPYLDRGEEVCVKGKGCSYNVSVKMTELLGGLADGDIWANDAWFNKSDILNKGGDLIYETNERDISKMPKVPKDVYSKLQVGDYVQLNRADTKSSGEFATEKKGNLQNEKIEHLGFIVGKDKDGTPLVWHGSETGKAYIKRIDEPITLDDHDKNIFTYQVSSIVRSSNLKNANLSGLQKTNYYAPLDPNQKLIAKKTATPLQRAAINTINQDMKKFKNLGYSQNDANYVGQLLVGGIMQNETGGGTSLKMLPKQAVATVWKEGLGQKKFEGDEASIGFYQMKPNFNFVNKDGSLNALGKKLEKLGVDPKKISSLDVNAQTKAGVIILLDSYEKLKKDKNFNIKTGLYKGKIPASYILAKSWQAGVDWQNRDKYKKFLNNLDVTYSDKALKKASYTVGISGSNKTVNNDYAKVVSGKNKIKAKQSAALEKVNRAKLQKERIQKANASQNLKNIRSMQYAESTAVKNLPTYNKNILKKPTLKPPIKKTNKPVKRYDEGGIITYLSPNEIENYKMNGYIIEELD